MSNYRGPGKYRHYKGGEYLVVGLALLEADLKTTYVVYKPLSLTSLLDDYDEEFWLRELADFNEQVQVNHDGFMARFTFIGGEAV